MAEVLQQRQLSNLFPSPLPWPQGHQEKAKAGLGHNKLSQEQYRDTIPSVLRSKQTRASDSAQDPSQRNYYSHLGAEYGGGNAYPDPENYAATGVRQGPTFKTQRTVKARVAPAIDQ
jgi:hypothetical protein